jgi:hypothetical protein
MFTIPAGQSIANMGGAPSVPDRFRDVDDEPTTFKANVFNACQDT